MVAGMVAGPFPLGTELILRFNVGPAGLAEDHARIIIGHVDDHDYVCLTPDQDLWVESVFADMVDILGVYVRPADRTMPFLLPPDGTYLHDFVAGPTIAQWDGLLYLGQKAGNDERIARGLAAPLPGPAGGAAGVGPAAVPGAIVPILPIAAGVVPPAVGGGGLGALIGAIGGVAPILPPVGGGIVGAPLPAAAIPPVGPAAAPAPAVAPAAPVAAVAGTPGGWTAPLAPPIDQRVMNVKYDHAGKRFRECRDALSIMQEQEKWDDWPITGPRTTRWCIDHMVLHAGSPKGWHQRWMSEMKLNLHDPGVEVHELCCSALELLITYDQFHVANCAAAEKLSRDLQMQEERYADRVQSAQNGSDEAAIFSGVGTRGNLCICPELKAHVAEELKSMTAVSKERRKAREERALIKVPKKGN